MSPEKLVRFTLGGMLFEYDETKNQKNIRNHGISFPQAARVFFDYDRIELFDEGHSEVEDRFNIIGDTSAGGLTVIGNLSDAGTNVDDTLDNTREVARWTSEVTHNYPEGVKGAEATASAIFLARTGSSKEEIKEYVIREFNYDLSRTCDEIRPTYHHVESCQQTVPEAITAFLEGNDFEDVIRTAVSLGGDCDTLTCIAGSIAEAYYGIPVLYQAECKNRLPADMLAVLGRFEVVRGRWQCLHDVEGGNECARIDKPDNHICFDVGDITELEVDAIVNATNTSLFGSGGVDGAIHRAAGTGLADECMRLKSCEVGEAKITAGWQLKAKHVIHTVGPRYEENNASCAELLYACYRNSLDLAKQYDLHSIAFPAISTGLFGYPKREAASVALRVVSDWFSENPNYGMSVVMSCHSQEMLRCYQNAVNDKTNKEERREKNEK